MIGVGIISRGGALEKMVGLSGPQDVWYWFGAPPHILWCRAELLQVGFHTLGPQATTAVIS